jgi:hypothetical protein
MFTHGFNLLSIKYATGRSGFLLRPLGSFFLQHVVRK